MNEVRIFDRALSLDEIDRAARVEAPISLPDIPPRVMPSEPPGPGRFGAYYARLKFYEEWDALEFPPIHVLVRKWFTHGCVTSSS